MSILNFKKATRFELEELIERQREHIANLTAENTAQALELDRLQPQRDQLAVQAKLDDLARRLDDLIEAGDNL